VIKNWNYTALLVDAIHTGQGNCWNTKIIKPFNMLLHSSQNFIINCCEFDEKITPITNLMYGARNNQATNKQSVWNNYKHKPKVENSEREKKREHKYLLTQFGPN